MHEKSIDLLNRAIADELTAVHQYMYFHFRCDDQSLDMLANLFRRIAIEEMLHIETLAERIFFLGGEVELAASAEVQKIADVKEMLKLASHLEEQSVRDYNNFAIECGSHADSVSKKLFEKLVEDEERHFDLFDTELGHLKRFGDQYLALQSIERTKVIGAENEPTEA
ncbi:MAG TPA: bacterioferritin [Candidatus Hydrogenedentes bacterium]|jgi:bacterioferritin|nr:MAG: Bacterioferritin [Candidatus Hydrogenedentes bacterium ADurb.Bin170]HOD94185.1 bacterioferritin [Candidatus Hydrogenedentota bacterium]HOM47649.1 bacterioferritin [Candidatus Hydrogenedentota bacterium]HOR49592.1 bacterioferritin [Candidatus Hydrogenedentota bacterium]HPK23565.1 bacterioferritin [Candidatus Hydrogenedentota bacterium]